MKRFFLILCSLFFCSCLFSEIKYYTQKENQENLKKMLENHLELIELYDIQMTMSARCDTIDEVRKLTKKKHLNLDDYFVKYLTVDENPYSDSPCYFICNIVFQKTNERVFYVYYIHDTIEEVYLIK